MKRDTTRRAYRDSRYGAGYDSFRIGLTYKGALRMMRGTPVPEEPESSAVAI